MHPLYRHIAACNQFDATQFTPLMIGGIHIGRVHARVLESIHALPQLAMKDNGLILNSADEKTESRTAALGAILQHLIKDGLIAKERFELYSVAPDYSAAPLALADRALMSALGLPATGIHCNAFVKKADGLYLWIARRSLTSAVDPGKLDHLVAGGQPHGFSLAANLAKEAFEEANIPPELAAKAVSTGIIRYIKEELHGLRRDTLFLFDLELPEHFQPRSNDGESFDFKLMHIDDVKNRLLTADDFKFNVPLVLIDFMIRRGFISPEEPGYIALACGLRKPFL